MLTPEQKKILSELKNTQFGQALRAFLDIQLDELNDITAAKSWDETLGRQHAVKVIKKLFAFMEEKKVTDKMKNQYM